MIVFVVDDETNYSIFHNMSTRKEGIRVVYLDDLLADDTDGVAKVYINIKPPEGRESICFVDSWGLSDDIPEAHILPRHDSEQKIRIVWNVLELHGLL